MSYSLDILEYGKLLDKRGRPYKWLRRGDMMRAKGSLARAGTLVSDTVTRDATLRKYGARVGNASFPGAEVIRQEAYEIDRLESFPLGTGWERRDPDQYGIADR